MRQRTIGIGLVLGLFLASLHSSAKEPAREFLDGLKARGFNDVAVEYLDAMATSRLAPDDLRQSVDYEKSLVLVAMSRSQQDPAVRQKNLDDAQALLKSFITKKPNNPKVNAARSQLGNLIVERARIKFGDSKKAGGKPLLEESRKLYEEAFAVFADLRKDVQAKLDKIPKVLDQTDKKQAALAAQRNQLRADNLQTELLAAAIREETADTVPEGSKKQLELLNEAALLYEGIYKNYRTRLAGLYARMYQGRCNQRMGKLRDALGFYGELLAQPDEPIEFQTLKTKTLRRAMECWLAPSQKKYLIAIKEGSSWLSILPRGKDRETDALAIRLSLARAYQMQADDLDGRDTTKGRTVANSMESARREATFVAGEPGQLQEEARQLVAELGGPNDLGITLEPDNFVQARKAGKDALDDMTAANQTIAQTPGKIRREKNAKKKSELEQELAAAKEKLPVAQADSMKYFRLALELADEETKQEDVNLVRYFLCYLYYLQQKYFDAALMGDFVAQRYPDSSGARQCAKISLASYLKLHGEAPEDESQFETEQVVGVANFIAETWPGEPEAIDALVTLVPFMVNAKQYATAREVTEKLPENIPQRGEAEITTGQAMWGAYLQGNQQLEIWRQEGAPDEVDLEAKRKEAEELKTGAKEILAAGYSRLPSDAPVTKPTVTALLSLAQAYVESVEPAKAVEVLKHETLGPLVLVNAKSDVVGSAPFIEETYRTALRGLIGSVSSGGDNIMEEAKSVMKSMQEAVGSDASGKQRMLSVYVSLAQDIEAQMKAADSNEAKQKLSTAFETFLNELSGGSTELGVLNWVAETFVSMGSGFDDDSGTVGPDATKYYEQATTAFDNILTKADLEPQMATQIKLRKSSIDAKLGKFDAAIGVFTDVLRKQPAMLNVQVEAARMLQAWGAQDPSKYMDAIQGYGGGAKPPVWGWTKVAKTTMAYQQFRDTLYVARLESARCRYMYALTKQGGEKKKLLSDALKTLKTTRLLYPTLGGKEMTAEYDKLQAEITTAQ